MQKETTTAKGVLFRHASVVTFSHHASGLDISKCEVSMTTCARKRSVQQQYQRMHTRKGPTMQTEKKQNPS